MPQNLDTIFALCTIEGKSGVSVFRISGRQACDVFGYFGVSSKPEPRMATLTSLRNPQSGDILDKCIVIYFAGPYSFTGEDVVEFHLHGSRAVINEVSSLLGKIKGFRPAEPGEFSMRAFENQKMDLTELEGLADLIDAETRLQQRQAMRQMSGELENLYETWRKDIISLLAEIEAYIDFPDEDLPDELVNETLSKAAILEESISQHLTDRRGEIIRQGVNFVILGAPNVGKSSLLNYLAKRDVAIVSDIEGTTRDVIEVHLDIDGYPVTITDTAGIRDNPNVVEEEGIRRALKHGDAADYKIVMLDACSLSCSTATNLVSVPINALAPASAVASATAPFSATTPAPPALASAPSPTSSTSVRSLDPAITTSTTPPPVVPASINALAPDPTLTPDHGIALVNERSFVLINKIDMSHPEINSADYGHCLGIFEVSVKSGEGLDSFLDAIGNTLKDRLAITNTPSLTRERHRTCLTESKEALTRFIKSLSDRSPIELCSEELRIASLAIGKITGKIDVEEVLGEIFSSFCIGK